MAEFHGWSVSAGQSLMKPGKMKGEDEVRWKVETEGGEIRGMQLDASL